MNVINLKEYYYNKLTNGNYIIMFASNKCTVKEIKEIYNKEKIPFREIEEVKSAVLYSICKSLKGSKFTNTWMFKDIEKIFIMKIPFGYELVNGVIKKINEE